MVPECKPEWNREAITVFSRLPSLMAADKPCPQLQPSLFPNSSYKLCNVHVFARAHFSHATQLGQPISCCRGSGSVLLQKWLNICYAVAQCRNLLKSSKICSCLLPDLQELMDLIIVSTLLQLFVLLM